MSDQSKLGLGQIITTEQHRDAIHVAVAPVKAAHVLVAAEHVEIRPDGTAFRGTKPIGIVDPFLRRAVEPDETFWLFLYPGTITSLRHEWAHPAFTGHPESSPATPLDPEGESKRWMEKWAVEHMGRDYYGDYDKPLEPAVAFANAIRAGEDLHIGPYESARDYIDDEWWTHWERLTGKNGQRGEYFSCAC